MQRDHKIRRKIIAQDSFAVYNKTPRLAPYDGECGRCKRNIYEPYHWIERGGIRQNQKEEHSEFTTVISLWKAGNELITKCCHCYYDFSLDKGV